MKTYLLQHTHKDVTVFDIALDRQSALSKFQWEGGAEFEWNGQMYDVIEKKIVGGHLVIRCLSDEKETALLDNFEKLHKQTNDPVSSKTASIYKLISSVYELPLALTDIRPTQVHITGYSFYKFTLPSYIHTVLTPPPQIS